MMFGDPLEKAAYDKLVARFKELHDQVTVELIHIPSLGDYRRRMMSDFLTSTPADVTLINYRRYAQFAAKNCWSRSAPIWIKASMTHTRTISISSGIGTLLLGWHADVRSAGDFWVGGLLQQKAF
jgi:hypothetical protein